MCSVSALLTSLLVINAQHNAKRALYPIIKGKATYSSNKFSVNKLDSLCLAYEVSHYYHYNNYCTTL
jgi:hypothetical protein